MTIGYLILLLTINVVYFIYQFYVFWVLRAGVANCRATLYKQITRTSPLTRPDSPSTHSTRITPTAPCPSHAYTGKHGGSEQAGSHLNELVDKQLRAKSRIPGMTPQVSYYCIFLLLL